MDSFKPSHLSPPGLHLVLSPGAAPHRPPSAPVAALRPEAPHLPSPLWPTRALLPPTMGPSPSLPSRPSPCRPLAPLCPRGLPPAHTNTRRRLTRQGDTQDGRPKSPPKQPLPLPGSSNTLPGFHQLGQSLGLIGTMGLHQRPLTTPLHSSRPRQYITRCEALS